MWVFFFLCQSQQSICNCIGLKNIAALGFIVGLSPWLSGKRIFLPMQETWVQPLVRKIPWRWKWQLTSARKTPWTQEPGGLQSIGSQRFGHNWAFMHSFIDFLYCFSGFIFIDVYSLLFPYFALLWNYFALLISCGRSIDDFFRFSLIIYFIHSSVYMSIPIS